MASFTALMFSLVQAECGLLLLGPSEKSLDMLQIVFTLYTALFETIRKMLQSAAAD